MKSSLFDNAPAITAEEIAERNKRNEAARKKTQTASGDNDDRQTSLVWQTKILDWRLIETGSCETLIFQEPKNRKDEQSEDIPA